MDNCGSAGTGGRERRWRVRTQRGDPDLSCGLKFELLSRDGPNGHGRSALHATRPAALLEVNVGVGEGVPEGDRLLSSEQMPEFLPGGEWIAASAPQLGERAIALPLHDIERALVCGLGAQAGGAGLGAERGVSTLQGADESGAQVHDTSAERRMSSRVSDST